MHVVFFRIFKDIFLKGMYKRKKEEYLECGIEVASKVFGGRWKPCILDAIYRGMRRPSEMHRYIYNATPRVINMQLKELEQHKIVYKKVYATVPLKTEYYLTEAGEAILPIIAQMDKWGTLHSGLVKEEATVALLET